MTYKIFSLALLIFATVAMATNADANIVTDFDASFEANANDAPAGLPADRGSDTTSSTINTTPGGAIFNSVYNTRSVPIGFDADPHESGVVPSSEAGGSNGLLYMNSTNTTTNPNITGNGAYHEFSIQVNDDNLNLDTLSFNYWASESSTFDQDVENDTNFTYATRVLASVNGSTFQTLGVTSGLDELTIFNPEDDDTAKSTDRFGNVVEFDASALNSLIGANPNSPDSVTFRLAFSDFTDTNGVITSGPDNASHIHRLDNVQLTTASAVPEPSALCLLIGSFGLLSLRRRR